MSPVSHASPAPRTARRCVARRCVARLRVLVVLVALLLAGAHTGPMEADTAAVCSSYSAWDTEEYDDLAAVPGPTGLRVRAPAPRLPHPCGRSVTRSPGPHAATPAAPARTPRFPALRALSTVVLRC
ncbi:hypothetical protein ABZ845_23645 [Streptomyces sp. NPDC047022]|uniref:hypothetical protein n=1 Tax=Streptomyces sp. NPDC047022 TaxID=3155737 RepID=UPI00340567D1